jgi:hypothetical protein
MVEVCGARAYAMTHASTPVWKPLGSRRKPAPFNRHVGCRTHGVLETLNGWQPVYRPKRRQATHPRRSPGGVRFVREDQSTITSTRKEALPRPCRMIHWASFINAWSLSCRVIPSRARNLYTLQSKIPRPARNDTLLIYERSPLKIARVTKCSVARDATRRRKFLCAPLV